MGDSDGDEEMEEEDTVAAAAAANGAPAIASLENDIPSDIADLAKHMGDDVVQMLNEVSLRSGSLESDPLSLLLLEADEGDDDQGVDVHDRVDGLMNAEERQDNDAESVVPPSVVTNASQAGADPFPAAGVCKHNPRCDALFGDCYDSLLAYYSDVQKKTQNEKRQIIHCMLAVRHRPRNKDQPTESSHTVNRRKKRRQENPAARARGTFRYQLFGIEVCRPFFQFVHGVGAKLINNIQAKLNDGHTLPESETKRGKGRKGTQKYRTACVRKFLTTFAAEVGFYCPDSRGSKKDYQPIYYLDSSLNKSKVWSDHYLPSVEDDNGPRADGPYTHKALGFSAFCMLWQEEFSWIRFMQPSTNYCDTCSTLREQNHSELLYHHKQLAKHERAHFKATVQAAQESRDKAVNDWRHSISFDYTEKAHLPAFKDQPSQYYYQTGYKLDIWGVCDDVKGVQYNYLLPEGYWPGAKGAESTCSLLEHYLDTYHGEIPQRNFAITTGNFGGQQKNRWFVWYCLYLAITRDLDVEWLMMVPGHATFFPDACFGLVKKAVKDSQPIHNPTQYARVVEESSESNRAVCGANVEWRRWKPFLEQFFHRTVPGLPTVRHFFASSTFAGIIKFKLHSGNDQLSEVGMFKEGITAEYVSDPEAHGLKPLSAFCFPAADAAHTATHGHFPYPLNPSKRLQALLEIQEYYITDEDKNKQSAKRQMFTIPASQGEKMADPYAP